MPTTAGFPTLSARVITQDELATLRAICDEHKFSYGVFCSVIVQDVITSEEQVKRYVRKTQQFEDDQQPASIAEMKALREELRQYKEELEQLRTLKEMQVPVLNGTR